MFKTFQWWQQLRFLLKIYDPSTGKYIYRPNESGKKDKKQKRQFCDDMYGVFEDDLKDSLLDFHRSC